MDKKFHLLARAVILREGRLLVARDIGEKYVFLPGGHIELGEDAHGALRREMLEELGREIDILGYLGAVEHRWPGPAAMNHEISHVFECSLRTDPDGDPVRSLESHLEFFFMPVEAVDEYDLRPHPFKALIRRLAQGDKAIWWGSTY